MFIFVIIAFIFYVAGGIEKEPIYTATGVLWLILAELVDQGRRK